MTYSRMGRPHSTIGAERFHFRVRNGIGWFPLAMATRQTGVPAAGATERIQDSKEHWRGASRCNPTAWVLYGQASRSISTG